MFPRRAKKRGNEETYLAMTEEEFDEFVALKLDSLITIGGAAAAYKSHLERHGFVEPIAQQLSAMWLTHMQSTLI